MNTIIHITVPLLFLTSNLKAPANRDKLNTVTLILVAAPNMFAG